MQVGPRAALQGKGENIAIQLQQSVTLAENPSLVDSQVLKARMDEYFVMAIGDSVAWGQGLSNQDKFHSRIVRWLQVAFGNRIGRLSSSSGTRRECSSAGL
jgi:hypothetical protein